MTVLRAWMGWGVCVVALLMATQAVAAGKPCLQGGCLGQLCIEADANVPSSCSPSPLYACYNDVGHCERQANGKCGWTQTPQLQHCLDTAGHAHLLELPTDSHAADPQD